ncbi:alpha/beta hydrolase [Brevibacterium sp.]|uniref:alpha/beta hydrolase n=1 Tax=Brevibacterium sp. TaxID=1701 RepID=UPI0028114B54|nr:alpha/beta hydrolase [Brevibacterium sp.]
MAVHDLTFPSSNSRDEMHAWLHTPVAERCRGLVQLAHGFGEHSRRYLPLVVALNDAGYAVAMDDHVGHGKTAAANDSWGRSGTDTYDVFVDDEKKLREIAQSLVPDVPYLVFGHSWGSMIMREFVAEDGPGIAGAVFCGTTGMMNEAGRARELAAARVRSDGSEAVDSEGMALLLGSFLSRYGKDANPLDWVSGDATVLADYASDPFNLGERAVTAGFTAAFCDLYARVDSPEWAHRIPRETSVFLIAGDQDPVGGFGAGVYQVANWLADGGHPDVSTRVWTGIRHEIHNQPELRDEVFAEVVRFFDRVTESVEAQGFTH